MDGTGVIAVHPQFQLFEAVGAGLVNGQTLGGFSLDSANVASAGKVTARVCVLFGAIPARLSCWLCSVSPSARTSRCRL